MALGLLCAWLTLMGSAARRRASGAHTRLVLRDLASAEGEFRGAHVGDDFGLGDAIKTELAATAEVQIVRGPRLKMKPRTLLRFRGRRPKARRSPCSRRAR